jgi:hypothetical protein
VKEDRKMTEWEWEKTERVYDLTHHKSSRSDRKRRLLACACARRVLTFLDDPRFTRAIECCEQYADATIGWRAMLELRKVVRTARHDADSVGCDEHTHLAAGAVEAATAKNFMNFKMALEAAQHSMGARSRPAFSEACAIEQTHQVQLARDIFGNPFRPVAFDPSWRTSTAIALAEGIYADRTFDRLPILADALEDAGCGAADLLTHLRGDGPHVRGCWALDLVLGKT